MYYTCYLSAMAQNGIGIERIQVGDLAVYYEADQYIHFKEWLFKCLENLLYSNSINLSLNLSCIFIGNFQ